MAAKDRVFINLRPWVYLARETSPCDADGVPLWGLDAIAAELQVRHWTLELLGRGWFIGKRSKIEPSPAALLRSELLSTRHW